MMACDFCKKRKLKCDKKLPVCTSCVKYGRECTFRNTTRVTLSKAREQRLEQRLAEIEDILSTKTKGASPCQGFRHDISEALEFAPAEDYLVQLEHIYFDKVHLSIPMMHQDRYFRSISLEDGARPPLYLRYAICALTASMYPKIVPVSHEIFYQAARKCLEDAEIRDQCLNSITLAQAQTWVIVGTYELTRMHFHRSYMSIGRAIRISQMMGLHLPDDVRSSRVEIFPPASLDWVGREEQRRTFWVIFCMDRFASVGHDWPMIIDEHDICITLPVSEHAFQTSSGASSITLTDALIHHGSVSLSSFSATVVMADICSRKLREARRFGLDTISGVSTDFWGRNRLLETTLNVDFCVPNHLIVSSWNWDIRLVFINIIVPSSTICVHQAAEIHAEKYGVAKELLLESKKRRVEAADKIITILKAVSQSDLLLIHPLVAWCVYVAAAVYAKALESQPCQAQEKSLEFLLVTLLRLKTVNPLPQTFLEDLTIEFCNIKDKIFALQSDSQLTDISASSTQGHLPSYDLERQLVSRTQSDDITAPYFYDFGTNLELMDILENDVSVRENEPPGF